jgi:hypothetical protein
MDIDAVRGLYDRYERREADFPLYRREATERLVRMVSLDGGNSIVCYSSLSEADADAAIEGELEYFKGLGLGFEWKYYSYDSPADLKRRLAAKGFSVGEDEAIMALELERLPPELSAKPAHDVRRVTDERTFADFAEASTKAWPDQEGHEALLASIAATLRDEGELLSAYVAYVEGVPVCSSRIAFPPASPFASLWGGATLEPYRGRGIYGSMLAARAREAIARGYRFLTIDASPMSRPIVAKRGFELLAISNPCDSPGRRAAPIK